MFTTIIVQPLFNLLVLIYGVLPGHNFGLAIILFTIVIRLLLWPLVKKQLHNTKKIRSLQPEIRRIKAETKGDKRKEQLLTMELYKERGISPFAPLGPALIQLPILIGLYSGLNRVIHHHDQIEKFAYPALQHLPWMKQLATNMNQFDMTLFHIVDLTRSALGPKGFYLPAMVIVVGSAVAQYYQSKQLMPAGKDARSLRQILKEASAGKQADQSEVNDAVARSTRFFIPVMIFFITVQLPSALGLYWLVSGLVALAQQAYVLREDEEELEATAPAAASKAGKTAKGKKAKTIIEGEVVAETAAPAKKKPGLNPNRRRQGSKVKRRG